MGGRGAAYLLGAETRAPRDGAAEPAVGDTAWLHQLHSHAVFHGHAADYAWAGGRVPSSSPRQPVSIVSLSFLSSYCTSAVVCYSQRIYALVQLGSGYVVCRPRLTSNMRVGL